MPLTRNVVKCQLSTLDSRDFKTLQGGCFSVNLLRRFGMRIDIDAIGPEGLDLDLPIEKTWVAGILGASPIYQCNAAGRLVVHLDLVDRVVNAQGQINLNLAATCSRCLKSMLLDLAMPFQVALFPAGEEPQPGADGELSADDMGVSTYEGSEVDLSNIVRDEVCLELPMSPLCAEDCAGLCPSCGQNLNEGTCGCSQTADPRWEALRQIGKASQPGV